MKIEELRIGNWVNHNNGKPIKINANHILYLNNNKYHGYEPIPLTPEILEKAGFKISITKTCYGLITEGGELRLSLFSDGRFKVDVYDIPMKIKYLHQLQNLYYALTGSELTIHSL